jgi:predicted amidohydrolase
VSKKAGSLDRVRIGMAQMRVEPGQAEANLRRAADFIAQAAQQRCDAVVLPECLDLGWGDPSALEFAQPIPGAHFQALARAARANNILVVAGLVERSNDKLYNAAVLIDNEGELRLLHRKLNELQDVTLGLYAVGDRLGVADTTIGRVGVSICADNTPESLEIGHLLARMGAQIILSPCAWAVPPDHDNETDPYGSLWRGSYGELARKHGLPVVGVSSVGRLQAGPWTGWPVIGASLAMGRDGEVAAKGPYGEAAEVLVSVELSLRALNLT